MRATSFVCVADLGEVMLVGSSGLSSCAVEGTWCAKNDAGGCHGVCSRSDGGSYADAGDFRGLRAETSAATMRR